MSEPLPRDGSGRADLAAFFAAMMPPPVHVPDAGRDAATIAAAAHARGFAEGLAEADARVAPVRAALAAATAALDAARVVDPVRLRPAFAALVTMLAEAVVMAELTLAPAVLDRLVEAALGAIESRDVRLRLNPDDAARLAPFGLTLVPDAALPPGTIVVDGPDFVVRDGLPERLRAVVADLV